MSRFFQRTCSTRVDGSASRYTFFLFADYATDLYMKRLVNSLRQLSLNST